MSEQQEELGLLEQTARDILGDVAGEDTAKTWQVLASAELPLLAVPEPAGGGWLAAAAAGARIAGEGGAGVADARAAVVAGPRLGGPRVLVSLGGLHPPPRGPAGGQKG